MSWATIVEDCAASAACTPAQAHEIIKLMVSSCGKQPGQWGEWQITGLGVLRLVLRWPRYKRNGKTGQLYLTATHYNLVLLRPAGVNKRQRANTP
jgi:nucleoid DNA-binding protein